MAARDINGKEFEVLVQEDKPVLVDFWAPWCGYCRRISRAYDLIDETWEDHIHVVKVNVDNEPMLEDREKIDVIPTLVLYRKGERLGSVVAPDSRAAIDGFIRSTLQL